jgi:hypothetical protein
MAHNGTSVEKELVTQYGISATFNLNFWYVAELFRRNFGILKQ